MAEITTLREAVATLVQDGDRVAMEGFTHLIPMAAGHEIIRQGKTDLSLVRMTPDLIYDQIIGMGLARELVFSWGGNPGVGSLHRLRDAVERGWPRSLDLREHSHAEMAASYAAGAANLPFGVLRGARGTDLPAHNDATKTITCPFTGEDLRAVEALRPDVAVIHAQQADRKGNVRMWGIVGVQKEAVLAAKRSIVTVEELVDAFEPGAAGTVLPGWAVSAVCEVPGGARPSYAQGYYTRDNGFYERWDAIARERETFRAWMDEHVMGTKDLAEYFSALNKVAAHG